MLLSWYVVVRRCTVVLRETQADDACKSVGIDNLYKGILFIEITHNHQILHSRTDFENWPEPERQRHLFRLWLAPVEARRLPAVFESRYGSIEPGARGGIITQNTKLTFSITA